MKKFYLLCFFGILPLGTILTALYLFDPFQLYHKPIFRKTIFNSNMHYQAAGIINNYDFDSIILGSSILVNTSSSEASKKIKNHWVNLSVSGGSFSERINILNYAIYKQKIKSVIFSLEPGWFTQDNTHNQYAYLYDKNRLNDFKTYIDESFILCLFISKICLKGKESIDRPSSWNDQPWVQQLLGGFNSWILNSNRPDMQKILRQILEHSTQQKSLKQIFPSKLISIITNHPDISFILVIPPFSRLYYKLNPISISEIIKQILHLRLPNIKIYGFDNTNIPDDLSHYIDLIHYDETINSFMLDAIKNNTHRITLENVDSYFQEMKKKVKAYDLEPLKQQIIKSGVLNK